MSADWEPAATETPVETPRAPGLPVPTELRMEPRRSSGFRIAAMLIAACVVVLCVPAVQREVLRWVVTREVEARGGRISIGSMQGSIWEERIVLQNVRIDVVAAADSGVEFEAAEIAAAVDRGTVFAREGRVLERLRIAGGKLVVRAGSSDGFGASGDALPTLKARPHRSQFDRFVERLEPRVLSLENCRMSVEQGEVGLGWDGIWLEAGERGGWVATGVGRGRWERRDVDLPPLQGAAFWRDGVLSIRGAALGEVTVRVAEADLAALGEGQVSAGITLTGFGGMARAGFHLDLAGAGESAEISGTATGIDAGRLAAFLGRDGIAGGSIEDVRFSFRGDPGRLRVGSGAVRLRVDGLRWKERVWDSVVLGATLAPGGIDVQTLELRQAANRVDLSGRVEWPDEDSRIWMPLFRASVDADARDLSAFALWSEGEERVLEGTLRVMGDIENSGQGARGTLEIAGSNLGVAGARVGAVEAVVRLAGSEVAIERFRLRQQNDFVEGHAVLGWQPVWRYEGELNGAIASLGPYREVLRHFPAVPEIVEGLEGRWSGDGTAGAHSGAFRLRVAKLAETDVASAVGGLFSATYSPGQIYFDRFELSQGAVRFSAKTAISGHETRLDDLIWESDRGGRISGWVKLPAVPNSWIRPAAGWQLDARGQAGGELRFEAADLEELATFAGVQAPSFGGVAEGQLRLTGSWAAPVWNGGVQIIRGWLGEKVRPALSELEATLVGAGGALLVFESAGAAMVGFGDVSEIDGWVWPFPGPWAWYAGARRSTDEELAAGGLRAHRAVWQAGWAGGTGETRGLLDLSWEDAHWNGRPQVRAGYAECDGAALDEVLLGLKLAAQRLSAHLESGLRPRRITGETGQDTVAVRLTEGADGQSAFGALWVASPDNVQEEAVWVVERLEAVGAPDYRRVAGWGTLRIRGFEAVPFDLAGDAWGQTARVQWPGPPPVGAVARHLGLSEHEVTVENFQLQIPVCVEWQTQPGLVEPEN